MISVSAPAKIILFGEHAVVHGQPAIAVPVHSLKARVRAEKSPPQTGLTIVSPALRQQLHVNLSDDTVDNTLVFTARLTLEKLGITRTPNILLILESEIPIGSGFGSGAAVSTAVARALSTILNQPLSPDDLNNLVFEVEKAHHGTPSGIDNTVIVYEKPIYFLRGQPMEQMNIPQPFTLLIGSTGHTTPTKITVGDVRALYEREAERIGGYFQEIGMIVRSARQAIEAGEPQRLGPLMNQNHTLLQKLTVSAPSLDVLCEAALDAGALGAKMSGGGRGGNMFALIHDTDAERITRVLRAAGAVQVIKTRLGKS